MICYHESLQDFEGNVGYDLIAQIRLTLNRVQLKQTREWPMLDMLTLDFNSLIQHTSRLLKESGTFWCVLPADRAQSMIEAGIEENLHLTHIYSIKPKKFVLPIGNNGV